MYTLDHDEMTIEPFGVSFGTIADFLSPLAEFEAIDTLAEYVLKNELDPADVELIQEILADETAELIEEMIIAAEESAREFESARASKNRSANIRKCESIGMSTVAAHAFATAVESLDVEQIARVMVAADAQTWHQPSIRFDGTMADVRILVTCRAFGQDS